MCLYGLVYFGADLALNKCGFSSGWKIVWPLNGVTIALLLTRRRTNWPAMLVGVATGILIGECVGNGAIAHREILQRLCSLLEVVLSALMLPPFSTLDRWLQEPRIFQRFFAALLVGPGVSGAAYVIIFHQLQNLPYLQGFNEWATADALGIGIVMPLMLSVRSDDMRRLFTARTWLSTVTVLSATLACTVLMFSVSNYCLIYLLYPALLMVDYALGFAGVSIAMFSTCLIAVYLTTSAHGPFGDWPSNLLFPRDVAFQFYFGFHVVAVFPLSLVLMERKKLSVRLAEANLSLAELASIDPLTSLANRRTLDQYLHDEYLRASRLKSPISLLMIDIDRFKQYNDFYGHIAGDDALRQVGAALARELPRANDLVARFGGEEFTAILPHTDNQGAMQIAEKLRAAIEELAIPHGGSSFGVVTLSIGCATIVPELGSVDDTLLSVADRALYTAKQRGRNRVGLAE